MICRKPPERRKTGRPDSCNERTRSATPGERSSSFAFCAIRLATSDCDGRMMSSRSRSASWKGVSPSIVRTVIASICSPHPLCVASRLMPSSRITVASTSKQIASAVRSASRARERFSARSSQRSLRTTRTSTSGSYSPACASSSSSAPIARRSAAYSSVMPTGWPMKMRVAASGGGEASPDHREDASVAMCLCTHLSSSLVHNAPSGLRSVSETMPRSACSTSSPGTSATISDTRRIQSASSAARSSAGMRNTRSTNGSAVCQRSSSPRLASDPSCPRQCGSEAGTSC
mmetsp:Transcript_41340/g.130385  ORF Transcript_41340/g.130385 Transcript_41340/m.130385 type:complete len:289 (-) Transcript_41340:892-1758(-)